MHSAPSPHRPRIVVLDDWERSFRRLGDWKAIDARADVQIHHHPLDEAALLETLREADVIVLNRDRTPLDAAQLAKLPKLRYVVFTAPRNLKLDRAALAARGIPVSNTEGGPGAASTTEQTWSLILAASRQLVEQVNRLKSGQWRADSPTELPGVLRNRRLGVIGLGNIGSRVAQIGAALGMEIVAWSPHLTPAKAKAHNAIALPLEELLSTSHVVTLHLVASDTTHHLLDATRLRLMRPDAILVNTSRAALINKVDLVAALQAGRPAMAAFDVFDTEPPPADDALLALPNVLATPHMGFISEPTFQRFVDGVIECLDAWLDGRPLVREVEPPAQDGQPA